MPVLTQVDQAKYLLIMTKTLGALNISFYLALCYRHSIITIQFSPKLGSLIMIMEDLDWITDINGIVTN